MRPLPTGSRESELLLTAYVATGDADLALSCTRIAVDGSRRARSAGERDLVASRCLVGLLLRRQRMVGGCRAPDGSSPREVALWWWLRALTPAERVAVVLAGRRSLSAGEIAWRAGRTLVAPARLAALLDEAAVVLGRPRTSDALDVVLQGYAAALPQPPPRPHRRVRPLVPATLAAALVLVGAVLVSGPGPPESGTGEGAAETVVRVPRARAQITLIANYEFLSPAPGASGTCPTGLVLPGYRGRHAEPRTPAPGLTVAALLLAGCTAGGAAESTDPPDPTESSSPTASASSPDTSASAEPSESDEETAEPEAQDTAPSPRPVSVLGLAAQRHQGDRLRLGAVRERTAAYTSYDVTYRSRSTTARGPESYSISGVLNVPSGRGPFPAVVLAHGYIDPAYYVRGQGMTRERGYLAARGYIALHVDYRNHAESGDDPLYQRRLRLGYTADVINAVKALRRSPDVPVDDDRVALFGRSMGGGVILKALIAAPGLVQAAAPWASVSSWEAENYRQFIAGDPGDAAMVSEGTPAQNPRFWRENSSRPYFDRITEPVLMVHGRFDDTCPPRWATATQRALVEAGVDSQLQRYDDGHAFGPAFLAAMDRTVRFFDRHL